ncbi:hypothetical protein SAMN04488515_1727 [Cognatiyoonia koreensis]|uniref:Major Facilitator Superfamily protein n=1 Tax=Cognatiyoonia koreensis TaxID=364200 RepID=A0A1I0Q7Y3_9RHOB|nr:MFS transporter [Cognatiyoonia koreensis]SEW22927.1 hypothetical protein SAMN04488515_1727 [Cognatiyoonia koreensis]
MSSTKIADAVFEGLTETPDQAKGLSDKAIKAEPLNFIRHILSLSGSKIADGLIDPKLVLSWLLTHLGAGAFWTGLLVPVRESLALLPQIFTAPRIARMHRRKWAWAGGVAVQGICAAGIAVAGLTLSGRTAGIVVVALLAVLALARSVCSASYKDVLGKTVATARRGTATGTASSVASAGVILFALLLITGWVDRYVLVIGAIFCAALFWIMASAIFATLVEEDNPAEPDGSAAQFALLREYPQLTRFIIVRSLLVGTALAPPYLVMLQGQGALGALGVMVLASSAASFLSSYVWGRLSDRSSRVVLQLSGLAGGAILSAVALVGLLDWANTPFLVPALLFGLMISYHGVRQGRSTHLVDMAPEDQRAAFTAVSNTLVGLALIAAGAAFASLATINVPLVIGVFAVMCLGGAGLARGLDEVQDG